ncbi:MAG: signal peptidase I, partial [Oscillospiraceae bacterium]|nr:signal peptidase I [Oscillospiraceae bacterium]
MKKTLDEIDREFEQKYSSDDDLGFDANLFLLELTAYLDNPHGAPSSFKIPVSHKNSETDAIKAKKRGFIRRLSNFLFYFAILAVLIVALTGGGADGSPKSFFGYSYFEVLTTSMQSEIPKGALVITKKVGAETIRVGDDVTYLRSDSTTVTHRVIKIVENYESSGARGFQTKGIENPSPDTDIVHSANIIGVVKLSIPEAGFALSWISQNILLVLVLFGVVILVSITLRMLFCENEL